MRCIECKKDIDELAFYCTNCGTETTIIKDKLSAKQAIRETWAEIKKEKSKAYIFSIFYVLIILLPISAAAFLLRDKYFILNGVLTVLVPLALIPFEFSNISEFKIGNYFANLKAYPKYLLFTFINIIYFFVIKIVCTGEPVFSFVFDPILHLVRLVLVLYWIAVVLPVPFIMNRYNVNPFKAVYAAYKGGAETRWQHFFIAFIMFVYIIVSTLLLGFGLLVTIPLTFLVIRHYGIMSLSCSLYKKYV